MIGPVERLELEPGVASTPTCQRLVCWARQSGVPVVTLDPRDEPLGLLDLGRSKRVLRVVRHAGAVLRPCTGRTDSLLCCNLRVVTQVVGCPLDCSYCILQQYQNQGAITVRGDSDQIVDQLERELRQWPRRLVRVCSGQVADSLALEPEVGFAAAAVQRFARLRSGVLELKTKTDRVGPLLGLPHGGRTVISFSVGPQAVTTAEELGAASLSARLAAARAAVAAGYLVGFHLDPLVTVDGDPRPHLEVVDQIAASVPGERVAFLSLGTVRYPPAMGRALLARTPVSRAALAELLPDVDGKLRLLAPLRMELYRVLARRVARLLPQVFVYLCMEPARVWRQALGRSFRSRAEVELALARSLHQRFGLAPCEPDPADYTDQ